MNRTRSFDYEFLLNYENRHWKTKLYVDWLNHSAKPQVKLKKSKNLNITNTNILLSRRIIGLLPIPCMFQSINLNKWNVGNMIIDSFQTTPSNRIRVDTTRDDRRV